MFTKNLAPPVKSAGNPFLPFTRFSDYENLQPPNAQNPEGDFAKIDKIIFDLERILSLHHTSQVTF